MAARIRSLVSSSHRRPKLINSSSSNLIIGVRAALRRIDDYSPRERKGRSQRLIKLSTAEGNNNYVFSLKELQLHDLANDRDAEAQVFIHLCVEKHAGYGLSVEGNITLTLPSVCRNCGSPYSREIDENFQTWVLPLRRRVAKSGLDVVGSEDDDVIYVKPGQEADIDSVVQDTMRLTLSIYETCSLCKKNTRPKRISRRLFPVV